MVDQRGEPRCALTVLGFLRIGGQGGEAQSIDKSERGRRREMIWGRWEKQQKGGCVYFVCLDEGLLSSSAAARESNPIRCSAAEWVGALPTTGLTQLPPTATPEQHPPRISHALSIGIMAAVPRPEDAFVDAPVLQKEILDYIARFPQSLDIFQRISHYIIETRGSSRDDKDGPAAKRRKLETISGPQLEIVSKSDLATEIGTQPYLLRIPDISFSIPQRKKFAVIATSAAIGAVNSTGGFEFGVFLKDIDYVACLPVPEKAVSHGISDTETDPLLFTVPDTPVKKDVSVTDTSGPKQNLIATLEGQLRLKVSEPEPGIFQSLAVNLYRKSESSFHVKSHLGIKEGFLFFLQDAIIWGFKKPLHCFEFDSIESSSYTSITQRTFSLTIRALEQFGGKEVEFSMIDQIEHPAIDEYLRRNQLKDASMAEARRAKVLPSLAKENTGAKSELQAAENEILAMDNEDDDEDDDDDYEEDGDEDRSDSGNSESGDSDTGSADNRMSNLNNLAEDELGSELEEVEITDDEE
ncbi:hypothetical protein H072_9337 [Dactylellina haptotyla CBS 200.50]|uniref:Histone chaperone RTT106/FACT complex subunit SPT16-like middle domain-containing protein n=1 Tax=Dactylellina haptotyla (strain CBS 200.50) TaxID=1284197 RepID=S8A7C8_DACHA|nr:hypothetical protein H072_9337 [Dactylellina haptotyla CBS 200.50]